MVRFAGIRQIVPALNKMLLNAAFDFCLNAMFNGGMDDKEHPEWALVMALGGAAKVAETLGYEKDGGVQRVQNWKLRGIPSHVKLKHPDLFQPHLRPAVAERRKASAATPESAKAVG